MNLSPDDIDRLAARWLARHSARPRLKIHTDTTDFFRIEYNDVLLLGENPYLIRHNAREGRFGLDDEVKFWVKRAIDLKTGASKIIKLVHYEKFMTRIGNIEFECFRSPKKEARILNLVSAHKNFMHGFSMPDATGNLVRVLEFIPGRPLSTYVESLELDHRSYFHEEFPRILDHFIECVEAIHFLHAHGEKHGDIRRDHILIDREREVYRWIDFDYNYRHRENIFGYDLFGLGNILMFLAGKGDVLLLDLKNRDPQRLSLLAEEDLNIVFHNRVANLKKIYPYIPESLNRVFLHFSKGAQWFYENTRQLLEDLKVARN
ncbi:MAG: protein kinase family protein [Desulfobacterales bacterium]|nr:MAG: protein kinase family protein [Desulfobacterales bacterium]